MAIAVVTSGSASATVGDTNATVGVTMPGGAAADQFAFCMTNINHDAGGSPHTPTISGLNGWTAFNNMPQRYSTADWSNTCYFLWRKLSSADISSWSTNTDITWSVSAHEGIQMLIQLYDGQDLSDPIAAQTDFQENTTSAPPVNITIPQHTGLPANTWSLIGHSWIPTWSHHSPDAENTERIEHSAGGGSGALEDSDGTEGSSAPPSSGDWVCQKTGGVASPRHNAIHVSLREAGAPSSAIKTVSGLAKASVKTVNGLAIASVKTINGLANKIK